ncbi:hypothetical protein ACFLY9_00095 [Patescibacteria group bacterium]
MELVHHVELNDLTDRQQAAIKSIATQSERTPYRVYQSILEIHRGLEIFGCMAECYSDRNISDHVSVDTISHVQLISTLLQNTLIRASLYHEYDDGIKWTDPVSITKTAGQELFKSTEAGIQITEKGIDAIRFVNRHFRFTKLTKGNSKAEVGIRFSTEYARFVQREIYSEKTEGLLRKTGKFLRITLIRFAGFVAYERRELSRLLIKEEVREDITKLLKSRFEPLILQTLFEGENWSSLNAIPLMVNYSDFRDEIPALEKVVAIGSYICRSFGIRYLSEIGLSSEHINDRSYIQLRDPFLFARAIGAFRIEREKWDALQVGIRRKLLEKTFGVAASVRRIDRFDINEFESVLQEVLYKVPNKSKLILLVATYGAACIRNNYCFGGGRLLYMTWPAQEYDLLERELGIIDQ